MNNEYFYSRQVRLRVNDKTGRLVGVLKKALVALMSAIMWQTLCPTVYANPIYSPYYRYFFHQRNDNEQATILDTLNYRNERVELFTKERSRQFGVRLETLQDLVNLRPASKTIQTIERRPITARSSLRDDGLIFQYWQLRSPSKPVTVLFGYTTDRNVVQVKVHTQSGERRLKLYDGRYFFCALDPIKERPIEAKGMSKNGSVIRIWNGEVGYPARRTWLSFFFQTYPYVVS